jgi:hypothetical protein
VTLALPTGAVEVALTLKLTLSPEPSLSTLLKLSPDQPVSSQGPHILLPVNVVREAVLPRATVTEGADVTDGAPEELIVIPAPTFVLGLVPLAVFQMLVML